MFNEERTVPVTICVPQSVLEQFDNFVREQSYQYGQSITRNSFLTQLMVETASRHKKLLEDEDAADSAALALLETGSFEDWEIVKARNGL